MRPRAQFGRKARLPQGEAVEVLQYPVARYGPHGVTTVSVAEDSTPSSGPAGYWLASHAGYLSAACLCPSPEKPLFDSGRAFVRGDHGRAAGRTVPDEVGARRTSAGKGAGQGFPGGKVGAAPEELLQGVRGHVPLYGRPTDSRSASQN